MQLSAARATETIRVWRSRAAALRAGLVGAVAALLFVASTGQAAKPLPTPPASFAVSGLTSAAAGTTQTVKVTALLAGKTNPGYRGTVVLSSTDAQAVLPARYTFTASDKGVHSFPVTLKTAGSQTVRATDTASAAITGAQTATVLAGPANTFALSGISGVTAGTLQGTTLTVRDAFGNVANGYRGTVRFTSSDSQAALPANHTFTASDAGSHLFGVTLKTAGVQTVTVTDTAAATLTVTSPSVTVTPANAASLTLGGLGDAVAGTSQNVAVTARDQYGNVATGYTGTVAFSSSDPQATLPANHTFTGSDAGSRSFDVTLKTAGQQSVTVTDQAAPSLSSSRTAAIESGPAEALDMSTDPALGQFQGSSVTTAGQSFKVVLTAIDAYGNRAAGYTGTVELTSTDEFTQDGSVEFTSGDAGRVTVPGIAFFAKKIYDQHASLTAADTGDSQLGDALTFQVLPGPAVDFSCPQPTSKASNYTKANGPVGVNDDLGLQFVALDAYGNNATNRGAPPIGPRLPFGYQATADVTTSDPQAVDVTDMIISASSIFVANPATVTLRTAGMQTVTITDPADASLTRACSYKVFAPKAITGTISVADPKTRLTNAPIVLAASTGVAANDAVTIDLVSVPVDGDSAVGLVTPIANSAFFGKLPYLQWDLNPSPLPPGTLTCDTSAPCTPDGPLQIAYTIQDAFGNPPSSGLVTIDLVSAQPPPGNILFNNGTIVIPNSTQSLPLQIPLAGTVASSNPAAGTAIVSLDSGASVSVAAVSTDNSLTIGAPVSVRLQKPTPITVDGNVGDLCVTQDDGTAVCSDESGCTEAASGPAPVAVCQKSSFAEVTVIPAGSDPDDDPPSLNVVSAVAYDICGESGAADVCATISFDFRLKSNGGPGLPPVGFEGLPYAYVANCTPTPSCAEYRFGATSTIDGVNTPEEITFAKVSGELPPGMSLSSNGLLSGTPGDSDPPGDVGTFYTFTVRATGQTSGATRDALLTVLISETP
jgi:hypothetical protein